MSSSAAGDSCLVQDVENDLYEGRSRMESDLNADAGRARARGERSSRGSDILCYCLAVIEGETGGEVVW